MKNIIDINKFLKDRAFKVWSYTVSHSFLIIRSPQKYNDMENFREDQQFNIDIEFFAVEYVNIPMEINTFNIISVNSEATEINNYVKRDRQNKLFEISIDDKIYHIIAGGFIIGKNNWVSEDRITNNLLVHDEIIVEM